MSQIVLATPTPSRFHELAKKLSAAFPGASILSPVDAGLDESAMTIACSDPKINAELNAIRLRAQIPSPTLCVAEEIAFIPDAAPHKAVRMDDNCSALSDRFAGKDGALVVGLVLVAENGAVVRNNSVIPGKFGGEAGEDVTDIFFRHGAETPLAMDPDFAISESRAISQVGTLAGMKAMPIPVKPVDIGAYTVDAKSAQT